MKVQDLIELIPHMQKQIADIGSIVTRIDKLYERELHRRFSRSSTRRLTPQLLLSIPHQLPVGLCCGRLRNPIFGQGISARGSCVYCFFLAFDRLVHAGLFTKFLQRGVPLIFLNVIMFWYTDLKCRVRWGESLSEWFDLKAGVRQGGIFSHSILYLCGVVDSLAQILKDWLLRQRIVSLHSNVRG